MRSRHSTSLVLTAKNRPISSDDEVRRYTLSNPSRGSSSAPPSQSGLLLLFDVVVVPEQEPLVGHAGRRGAMVQDDVRQLVRKAAVLPGVGACAELTMTRFNPPAATVTADQLLESTFVSCSILWLERRPGTSWGVQTRTPR